MSDEWRRIIERQNEIRRLLNPFGDTLRGVDTIGDIYKKMGIGEHARSIAHQEADPRRRLSGVADMSVVASTIADIDRQRGFAHGAVEEARRLGLFDRDSYLTRAMGSSRTARDDYDRLFRRPEGDEIGRITREALAGGVIGRTVSQAQDSVSHAMGTMHSPWLRIEKDLASAKAFAEIIGIGRSIAEFRGFDSSFGSALRTGLGDWRDPISFEPAPLIDPFNRTALYADRGFDFDFTDFTPEAFDEGLLVAGLGGDVESETDGDDEGFVRASLAYDRLHRLEAALRLFIAAALTAAFGADWMKTQLPPNMLDSWVEKRDKAIRAGQPEFPLIDYADFTDYKPIIERKDNWERAFRKVFRRPEDIRESFQRLFPVRIATMHSRIITQEDELLLRVEVARVHRAIEKG